MIDYAAILRLRYPDSEWTLNGDDYSGLVWLSETTKPTKKKLDDEWNSVKAELEAAAAEKENARLELLNRLGITVEEVKLLLS